MKAKIRKSDMLALWAELPENQNPLASMEAIPYKAEGSKYGACGIRIDGTPEFIDAVLGRLKSLLDGENAITRLDASRRPVESVEIHGERKTFTNRETDAEVCYVRLAVRGREAMNANTFWGGEAELKAATVRFASVRSRAGRNDGATRIAKESAGAIQEHFPSLFESSEA